MKYIPGPFKYFELDLNRIYSMVKYLPLKCFQQISQVKLQ